MTDTNRGDMPTRILLGTVTSVNTAACSLSIRAETTGQELEDVPFLALYSNALHGGGAYVMPEVGSRAYVAIASDNTRYVFGFVVDPSPADNAVSVDGEVINLAAEPSYRGNRPVLDPGDVVLATKGRNRVVLKRGGMIEIAGNALCTTRYLPLQGMIAQFFRQYRAVSPLGHVEWTHSSLQSADDPFTADSPDVYAILAGNYKADTLSREFAVEVRVGHVDEPALDADRDGEHRFGAKLARQAAPSGGVGRLSVLVRDGEGAARYSFCVDDLGNAASKAVTLTAEVEEATVDVREVARLVFGGSLVEAIRAESKLRAMVGAFVIDAVRSMAITTRNFSVTADSGRLQVVPNGVSAGPSLRVGGGSAPVIVDRGLLQFLVSHTHPLPGGGVTGPSPTLGAAEGLGRSVTLFAD